MPNPISGSHEPVNATKPAGEEGLTAGVPPRSVGWDRKGKWSAEVVSGVQQAGSVSRERAGPGSAAAG